MERKPINFNPTDLEGMRKLMDEHGDSKISFNGMNENLEEVEISISRERIDTVTFQHNGWVRKNIYWRDGTREELFKGRWKALDGTQ